MEDTKIDEIVEAVIRQLKAAGVVSASPEQEINSVDQIIEAAKLPIGNSTNGTSTSTPLTKFGNQDLL
ncbi:MAG: hypothetical protein WCP19_14995, partial [Chloroflexota bacterium]